MYFRVRTTSLNAGYKAIFWRIKSVATSASVELADTSKSIRMTASRVTGTLAAETKLNVPSLSAIFHRVGFSVLRRSNLAFREVPSDPALISITVKS